MDQFRPKTFGALVIPHTVNGSVGFRQPPKRKPNAAFRSREYLTDSEVERLIKAIFSTPSAVLNGRRHVSETCGWTTPFHDISPRLG
jgi:hypothetical protein